MTNTTVYADELAAKIRDEHDRAYGKAREALEHARRAGELLIEAKRQVGHGGWLGWLREHVNFGERTAQGYMRLARDWDRLQAKSATVADMRLRDALALLAAPEGPSPEAKPAAPLRAPDVFLEGIADNARFGVAPAPAARLVALTNDDAMLVVEPAEHLGFFFVTVLDVVKAESRGLRRPIRFDMVGATLRVLGVPTQPLAWTAEPIAPTAESRWFPKSDTAHYAPLQTMGIAR